MQEEEGEWFLTRQRVCDIFLHVLCARFEIDTRLAEKVFVVSLCVQGRALKSVSVRQGVGKHLKTEQLRHFLSVWL